MRKDDARKLNRDAQEALRIRAVNSVRSGENPEVVAKTLGINRSTIYDWIAKYREGGELALKKRKAPGRPPRLMHIPIQLATDSDNNWPPIPITTGHRFR